MPLVYVPYMTTNPEPSKPKNPRSLSDARLPTPGSIIEREYKGKTIKVTVKVDGFDYEGTHYTSLSTIAKNATGAVWNGFKFFRLTGAQGTATTQETAEEETVEIPENVSEE